MAKPVKMMSKKRILFMLAVYFLLSVGMICRLAYWQLYKSDWLEAKALSQWTLDVPVEAKRGTIYDAKGRPLAISVSADTVAAVPAQIGDKGKTAELLAPLLDMSASDLLANMERSAALVYLKRKITSDVAQTVRELGLPGIHFMEESRRYYPNGSLASHVLGFVGMDQGWNGIEIYYEDFLKGTRGEIQFEVDARQQEQSSRDVRYVKPIDGYDMYLTLDRVIQSIVETKLEEALELHKAEKVGAVVMDAKTGAILALVNLPDYDPNNYQAYDQVLWRNSIVSDAFEPGSTFKIVTMAAALEQNMIDLDRDTFYDPGYAMVSGIRIGCWRHGGHGSQTYREVMHNSCNPGFINLGLQLGKDTLLDYIERFGFGSKTGIDLPGEGAGVMFRLEQVGPVELATTSFGQGPAVTPLQQAVGIGAVASGGLLPIPYVVDKIVDKEGHIIYQHVLEFGGRAIEAETADIMRELLESTVTDGTARRAYLEGFRVAGKTGTAQVPRPEGGYYPNKYIASFNGFAPADDPAVVMYVAVYDPKGPYGYYGGTVAGPLFGEILAEILYYLGVQPQIEQEERQTQKVMVPDVVEMPAAAGVAQMRARGLVAEVEGSLEGKVLEQMPPAGVEIPMGTKVILRTTPQQYTLPNIVAVPDVHGLSMREASNVLGLSGLRINIIGSGMAIGQDIPPYTEVNRNSVVTVEFGTFSP